MSRYVFKLPDLGEGAVDAEIVAWKVAAGEQVQEDQPLVEMLTQKATVEVPAPVAGRVLSTTGSAGDRIAVGAELAVFETGAGAAAAEPARAHQDPPPATAPAVAAASGPHTAAVRPGQRVATSPAIRRRAREAGVDLAAIAGSGPHGRIVLADLESHLKTHQAGTLRDTGPIPAVREIPVTGLRRLIAEQVSHSARTIPHFSYVEEVDVTALEALREQLNAGPGSAQGALSYLPFIVLGLIRALAQHPQCNGRFDETRQLLLHYRAVHVGIAVQTPQGLKVPVIHDAQELSLKELDAAIRRLSNAARDGRARPAELTGSTITVTSLGKLGGIASTPIINQPELAIIGVNRAVERPVVRAGLITVRRMMNLSSSFDHRFVDGFDAARLIQTLRESLEQPALLFIDHDRSKP
ncbi:MAG TPA: dihydrolipoamide acetyltransferase family protein [Steroidobacteraceae bacterium]|jgi:2-oxoisovalerate dehydrogenase E2 component (dihydrolipoyl transacylase)|nr:dihydrolipoamide acetyltransferase family protein [Steroidobacteraceae bacterium]